MYAKVRSQNYRLDFAQNTCVETHERVVQSTDDNEAKYTYEFRITDLAEARSILSPLLLSYGIKTYDDDDFVHCNRYTAIVAEGQVDETDRTEGWFYTQGITGEGETIGVTDTGLNTRHCFFTGSKKVALYFGVDTTDAGGHGTHVSSTACGGLSDGTFHNFSGVAYDAKIAMYDMNDGSDDDSLSVPYDISGTIFSRMNTVGAAIISNSWGSLNMFSYSVFLRHVDEAALDYPNILSVYAAGNMGPTETYEESPRILSPALSLSALSVGATMKSQEGLLYTCDAFPSVINCGNIYATDSVLLSEQSMADFSSAGSGGIGLRMIKPDVVLPGTYVIGADQAGSGGCSYTPQSGDGDFSVSSGTSMATPGISGLAALIRQYADSNSNLTSLRSYGMGLRAAVVHTAKHMSGYLYANDTSGNLYGVPIPTNMWPNAYAGFGLAGANSNLLSVSYSFHGTLSRGESKCYTLRKGSLAWRNVRATMAYMPNTLPSYGETRPHMILRDNVHLFAHESTGLGLLNANTYFYGYGSRDRANNVQQILFQDYQASDTEWIIEVVFDSGASSEVDFDLIATGTVTETTCPANSVANAMSTSDTSSNTCVSDCSGNGTCSSGVCTCNGDYTGIDCSIPLVSVVLHGEITYSLAPHTSATFELTSDSQNMLDGEDWILEIGEMDLDTDMVHFIDSGAFTMNKNQKSPATLIEISSPCVQTTYSLDGASRYVVSAPVAQPSCTVTITNADTQWTGTYTITTIPADESKCADVSCNDKGMCVSGICYCYEGYTGTFCTEEATYDDDDGDNSGASRLIGFMRNRNSSNGNNKNAWYVSIAMCAILIVGYLL